MRQAIKTNGVTISAFDWYRGYSALPAEHNKVHIPAGTPCELSDNDCWYVVPEWFSGAIERHDATFHGCHVEKSNVSID